MWLLPRSILILTTSLRLKPLEQCRLWQWLSQGKASKRQHGHRVWHLWFLKVFLRRSIFTANCFVDPNAEDKYIPSECMLPVLKNLLPSRTQRFPLHFSDRVSHFISALFQTLVKVDVEPKDASHFFLAHQQGALKEACFGEAGTGQKI